MYATDWGVSSHSKSGCNVKWTLTAAMTAVKDAEYIGPLPSGIKVQIRSYLQQRSNIRTLFTMLQTLTLAPRYAQL